jgi:hypothetical protein
VSLELLYGLPGGGKSMLLMKRLVHDMRSDWKMEQDGYPVQRLPYFFISVDLDGEKFWSYLREEKIGNQYRVIFSPVWDFDVRHAFWRVRGWGDLNPRRVTLEGSNGEREGVESWQFDFEKVSPMRYYLDEMHRDFRARDHRFRAPEAEDYLSQHEHVGDKILGAVQDPAQLDVMWRRLTETFTHVGNASRRKMWGLRGPRAFQALGYSHWPVREGDENESGAMPFGLDKRLAACYHTAVVDRGVSDKRGGWSIWWLVPAAVLVCALAFAVLKWAPGYAGRWLGRTVQQVTTSTGAVVGGTTASVTPILQTVVPAFPHAAQVVRLSDAAPVSSVVTVRQVEVRSEPVRERILSYVETDGKLMLKTTGGWYRLEGGSVRGEFILFQGRTFKIGGQWIQ